MVHRIQNRNPGYSDFSNLTTAQSFNFGNNSTSTPVTDGANALKVENEIVSESQLEESNSDLIREKVLETQNNNEVIPSIENVSENNPEIIQESNSEPLPLIDEVNNDEKPSNGLENFGIEEQTPDLFNSDEEKSLEEFPSPEEEKQDSEEDELEIPAFLRRQKN